jgi:hypothetical protein
LESVATMGRPQNFRLEPLDLFCNPLGANHVPPPYG